MATNVGQSETGGLRIELAIRNDTTAWSMMHATEGASVALTGGDGTTTDCETVFMGTGGHRLAPGFQMTGYIAGTKTEPITQLIFVECAGGEIDEGATLSIPYTYYTGEYNYYEQDANLAEGTMEVDLGEIAEDLSFPIGEPVDGLIQTADAEINALNDVTLVLAGAERTGPALVLTWVTENPGDYATYVHVGNPPVIGNDGILYGLYESPDIVSTPITPAGGTVEWTTEVAVPEEVGDLYVLPSVESKQQRLFVNYALDISYA